MKTLFYKKVETKLKESPKFQNVLRLANSYFINGVMVFRGNNFFVKL